MGSIRNSQKKAAQALLTISIVAVGGVSACADEGRENRDTFIGTATAPVGGSAGDAEGMPASSGVESTGEGPGSAAPSTSGSASDGNASGDDARFDLGISPDGGMAPPLELDGKHLETFTELFPFGFVGAEPSRVRSRRAHPR